MWKKKKNFFSCLYFRGERWIPAVREKWCKQRLALDIPLPGISSVLQPLSARCSHCFLSQIQVKGAELYVNTSEALLHFQLPVSITVTEKMLAPAKLQCKQQGGLAAEFPAGLLPPKQSCQLLNPTCVFLTSLRILHKRNTDRICKYAKMGISYSA